MPPAARRRRTSTSTPSTRSAVNTGGNDLQMQTGGLGINFVTRRGTNQFKGNAERLFTTTSLESSNLPDELVGDRAGSAAPGQGEPHRPDPRLGLRPRRSDPQGQAVVLGLVRQNDINIIRLNQTSDQTLLKNTNAKINWQTRSNDSSRSSSSTATRKSSAARRRRGNEDGHFLWNQGSFYPEDGPHGLWKSEATTCSARTSSSTRSTRTSARASASRRAAATTRRRQLRRPTTRRTDLLDLHRAPRGTSSTSAAARSSPAGRQPRVQVRLRLSAHPDHLHQRLRRRQLFALNAQRHRRRMPIHARPGRQGEEQYTRFFGDTFTKGRHDPERGRPLGPPGGKNERQHRSGEHGVPGLSARSTSTAVASGSPGTTSRRASA